MLFRSWFTPDGQNGSPIAAVIAEDLTECDRLLIDTGYASRLLKGLERAVSEKGRTSDHGHKAASAILTDDGQVIAAGDQVAREAEAVALNCYRNYLKGQYSVSAEALLVDKAQLLTLTAPEMTGTICRTC